MDQELSWPAWNHCFEQWTAAKHKHEDLKTFARAIGNRDPRAAARIRDVATSQWLVVLSTQRHMQALMVALLLPK